MPGNTKGALSGAPTALKRSFTRAQVAIKERPKTPPFPDLLAALPLTKCRCIRHLPGSAGERYPPLQFSGRARCAQPQAPSICCPIRWRLSRSEPLCARKKAVAAPATPAPTIAIEYRSLMPIESREACGRGKTSMDQEQSTSIVPDVLICWGAHIVGQGLRCSALISNCES